MHWLVTSIAALHTSDFLLLLQTIILGVTAYILWIYTVETRRLREAAQFQASLLAQDLRDRRESLEVQKKKELKEAQPVFSPGGAMFSGGRGDLSIRNVGALAKQLSVSVDSPLEAKIIPAQMLSTGELGKIIIERVGESHMNREIPISLKFLDSNNEAQEKKFVWKPGEVIREIEG